MPETCWIFSILSTGGGLMLFRAGASLHLHCLLLELLPVTNPLEMLLSLILVSEKRGLHSSSTWSNYKGLWF